MSVESVIPTNLCPTALIPPRTSSPKSSSSGKTRRKASNMCLHSRIGSLSCSSREIQAKDSCFFYLTPVGQERRLPVASRSAYDANPEVQGVPEELQQPATDHVLGARQRSPQLGL